MHFVDVFFGGLKKTYYFRLVKMKEKQIINLKTPKKMSKFNRKPQKQFCLEPLKSRKSGI